MTDIAEIAKKVFAQSRAMVDAKVAEAVAAERERWQARVSELVAALDKHHGTPCEQIRHQQELAAERERCAKLEEMLSQSIALMRAWGYRTHAAAYEQHMKRMTDDKKTYMLKAQGHQTTFVWEGEHICEHEWYWRALTQRVAEIEKLIVTPDLAAERERCAEMLERGAAVAAVHANHEVAEILRLYAAAIRKGEPDATAPTHTPSDHR